MIRRLGDGLFRYITKSTFPFSLKRVIRDPFSHPCEQLTALLLRTLVSNINAAMSARRKTPLNDGKSLLATSSHQIAQQAFPFSQLPRELRYEIYILCLASKSPTIIIYEGRPYFEEHGSHPKLKAWPGRDSTMGTSLLLLNHSIYDEAISILYGRNSFLFSGRPGWTAFFHFRYHLTEASRRHLRSLEFTFPDFDRSYLQGTSSGAVEVGPESLKGFPHLKSLTFHVYDNITDNFIMLLQKIHDSCPHGCQINILAEARFVSIGSSALRKMQEWNWKMSGNLFVTIDDRSR